MLLRWAELVGHRLGIKNSVSDTQVETLRRQLAITREAPVTSHSRRDDSEAVLHIRASLSMCGVHTLAGSRDLWLLVAPSDGEHSTPCRKKTEVREFVPWLPPAASVGYKL